MESRPRSGIEQERVLNGKILPQTMDGPGDFRSPLRVLLVEDHAESASALAFMLRQDGCIVYVASTVQIALDLAARHPVDLVISDLGLPDGDGRDLMAHLNERYHLRGIALTGRDLRDEGDTLRGRGFVEALIKPVDFTELFAAVHGAAPTGSWQH